MQKTLSIKLAVIGVVTLLLLIPLSMISEKIYERSHYLDEAKRSVSQSWTGNQTIMSALVVIPYVVNHKTTVEDKETKKKLEKIKPNKRLINNFKFSPCFIYSS